MHLLYVWHSWNGCSTGISMKNLCHANYDLSGTQVTIAIDLGVLAESFKRTAKENGVVHECKITLSIECWLTEDCRMFILPPWVLYAQLHHTVSPTPATSIHIWLHCRNPNFSSKRFVGVMSLFKLSTMLPVANLKYRFLHCCQMQLMGTRSTCQIHDDMSLTTIVRPSETLGQIPLSAFHLEFWEQHYWQLPIKLEVILSGLMEHVAVLGLTATVRRLY